MSKVVYVEIKAMGSGNKTTCLHIPALLFKTYVTFGDMLNIYIP